MHKKASWETWFNVLCKLKNQLQNLTCYLEKVNKIYNLNETSKYKKDS